MSMSLKFEVSGPIFSKTRSETVYKVFRSAMEESLQLIAATVIKYTPRGVTGNLKRSIPASAQVLGGMTRPMRGEVGTPLKYGLPVERGIRPHRGFPALDPLKDWIKRKLKPSPEDVDSLTFRIARSIFEKGTMKRFGYKGAQMFEKAFDEVESKVVRIFEQAGFKLAGKTS